MAKKQSFATQQVKAADLKVVKNKEVPIQAFPGVEKVKQLLFLRGIWNATLTTDNKLYIEVVRGQMIDKAQFQIMKTMAPIPPELMTAIEAYYDSDWAAFK